MSDLKEMIRQANETAVNKLKNAQPYWVDIKPAHEVLGIDKYTLLHAHPLRGRRCAAPCAEPLLPY